jgi:hypothetical protein
LIDFGTKRTKIFSEMVEPRSKSRRVGKLPSFYHLSRRLHLRKVTSLKMILNRISSFRPMVNLSNSLPVRRFPRPLSVLRMMSNGERVVWVRDLEARKEMAARIEAHPHQL